MKGHIGVGVTIGLIAGVVLVLVGVRAPLVLAMAPLAATTIVGVAKEVYDGITEVGQPRVMDFVSTVFGGVMASIALVLLVAAF